MSNYLNVSLVGSTTKNDRRQDVTVNFKITSNGDFNTNYVFYF